MKREARVVAEVNKEEDKIKDWVQQARANRMSKRKRKRKKRKRTNKNRERKREGKEVHQDLNQVRLFLQAKMTIELNIFIKIVNIYKNNIGLSSHSIIKKLK